MSCKLEIVGLRIGRSVVKSVAKKLTHIGLFVFLRLGFWVKNGIMVVCSSPISSTKRHSVMLLAMKNDQKSTLSFKSEARGHEKGQLRPKSQLATGCSIFLPNEDRN